MRSDRLIEIHNGHPRVHNVGGGDWSGIEYAWDALLTRGTRIYGIAVDDAHHFRAGSRPPVADHPSSTGSARRRPPATRSPSRCATNTPRVTPSAVAVSACCNPPHT